MKLNQLIEILTFPAMIQIAEESISEQLQSKNDDISKFNKYRVKHITTDTVTNQLTLQLLKIPTLEELGYTFESGV
jgi:hypothetical protein